MAEGLVNELYHDDFQAFSAGTERTKVKALAIEAMAAAGIDISQHKSQHIDDFMDQEFDLVVTVCDSARETCPYFPRAKKQIHASFPDPSLIEGDHQTRLNGFIQTRRDIEAALPNILDISSV